MGKPSEAFAFKTFNSCYVMKGCVSVSRWGWGSNGMCRVKKLHLKLYAKIWSGASNLSLIHLALRRSEKSLCSYFPPKASWVSPVAPLLKSTVLNFLHLPITQRVLSVWSSPLSSTPPHPSLAISASSFRVQSRWLPPRSQAGAGVPSICNFPDRTQ